MSDTADRRAPLPLILIIKYALNVVLVWLMADYLDVYFQLTGGFGAYIVVGALLTLMNIVVRPVLNVVTLPLKLFATLIAVILVQTAFVQLAVLIVQKMDPEVVTLEIFGGLWGWIVVASILGFGNWLMKVAFK